MSIVCTLEFIKESGLKFLILQLILVRVFLQNQII